MAHLNRFTGPLVDLDTMYVFDHFTGDQSDVTAVDTVTDTGTALVGDEVGGVITLTPSDGTVADNDEVYLATPNELFKFGTNRTIYGKARVKYAEVTANVLNVCLLGFQNAVGADSIVDNGAGLKTSGSTLGIYTVDGGSGLLRVVSACNGTATTTVTNKTVAAGTWYTAEIECRDWDGVKMQVAFKLDGDYLRDSLNRVIYHEVAIASATEMQMFVGAKLGAATNNDTLKVDYWYGATCQAP
jgi:hypothetical protein